MNLQLNVKTASLVSLPSQGRVCPVMNLTHKFSSLSFTSLIKKKKFASWDFKPALHANSYPPSSPELWAHHGLTS